VSVKAAGDAGKLGGCEVGKLGRKTLEVGEWGRLEAECLDVVRLEAGDCGKVRKPRTWVGGSPIKKQIKSRCLIYMMTVIPSQAHMIPTRLTSKRRMTGLSPDGPRFGHRKTGFRHHFLKDHSG